MLVVMKYVSSMNNSRDRSRFQEAKSRFDAEEATDLVFKEVRDKTFTILKKTIDCFNTVLEQPLYQAVFLH